MTIFLKNENPQGQLRKTYLQKVNHNISGETVNGKRANTTVAATNIRKTTDRDRLRVASDLEIFWRRKSEDGKSGRRIAT
jgi:hypothetical protein